MGAVGLAGASLAAGGRATSAAEATFTLTTPYPSIETQPGSTVKLTLKVASAAPEAVDLALSGVPDGWTTTMRGGGFVVHSVTAAPDAPGTADLEIQVPEDAASGDYPMTVTGTDGAGGSAALELTVDVEEQVDNGIAVTADFPSLSGDPATAFAYTLTITNNTPESQTFTFDPSGPQGWTVTASPTAEEHAQTVTVDAGSTGNVKVTATPPATAEQGSYPIDVTVTADNGSTGSIELTAEVTGTPQLELSTADQRLDVSGRSNQEHRVPMVIANSGTAPLEDVKLAGTAPSGWDVSFDPQEIAEVKPGETAQVTAIVKPAADAVARRLRAERAGQRRQPVRHRRPALRAPRIAHARPHRHRRDRGGGGGARRGLRPLREEVMARAAVPVAERRSARAARAAREALAAGAAAGAAIRTSGLTKRYGDTVAVDGLDLTIRRGEVFGLLGPNGAGKTTTILMLLGLSEPSAGQAAVDGLDPTRDPMRIKARVGYLPDDVGFYDHLTARENLRYTAALNRLRRADADARIESVLADVGLADDGDRRVGGFSRGMRQRLGLADALVKRPSILILDEPTVNIDPEGVRELLLLVERLRTDQGVTVLLASHLLHQVEQVCDRIGIFVRGRLVTSGTIDQLAAGLTDRWTFAVGAQHVDSPASLLGAIDGVGEVRRADSRWLVSADRDVGDAVQAAIASAGGRLTHFSREAADLDAIYHRYFLDHDREEAS